MVMGSCQMVSVVRCRGQRNYERYTWKEATYSLPNTKYILKIWNSMSSKINMLTAEGQHFIPPLNIEYILY